jgi:hypothetical protein
MVCITEFLLLHTRLVYDFTLTETLLFACDAYRFLLKYSSRDEVELLDQGNAGIVEMRNAIAGFEEESPLYGFLRYRRRNVIVKYLPEDCSRLIQGMLLHAQPRQTG